MTLRTLNYGNYGIFLIMGHAGFCPSTVVNRAPFLVLANLIRNLGLRKGIKGPLGGLVKEFPRRFGFLGFGNSF